MAKIILDLCGGTGSWSRPYKDAGYDVRVITLPEHDVRGYVPPDNVYGILAAPPCTHFSSSGARWWPEKDKDGRTLEDMGIVLACLRIIASCRPAFWCLENPVGRLRRWMGQPVMYFNPCDYGDPFTKKTALWGRFNVPEKTPCRPLENIHEAGHNKPERRFPSKMHLLPPTKDRAILRAITPPGFAQAFYKANK